MDNTKKESNFKHQKKSQKSRDAIIQEGKTLEQQHQWDEAIAHYHQAIQENPTNHHHYYLALGDIFKFQGDLDSAINYYSQAVDCKPDFQKVYMRFKNILKLESISDSNVEKIIEVAKLTLKAVPDNLHVKPILADALSRQGNIAQAIQYNQSLTYQKNLISKPDYVQHHWQDGQLQSPDFIVIGSMKCGTTVLYDYITKHPKVLTASRKEVKFFANESRYKLGLNWYLSNFPPRVKDLGYIAGEASPNYIRGGKKIPQRIHEVFPNIKLIVILRDPVKRAFSNYHFNRRKVLGKTWQYSSLEEALTSELKKIQTNHIEVEKLQTFSGLILCGLYVYQLQQWIETFSREQILILNMEDLKNDALRTLNQVFEFLDLPCVQELEISRPKSSSYESISEDLSRKLYDFFRPHNQKLEDYLGMKFNWE